MAEPRLLNKVAIITGGATGIGEAISHKFCSKEQASLFADFRMIR
jgi:NAD(P)-dependent dehydrogenase (short-subunit alcohol dehydrogenase family)